MEGEAGEAGRVYAWWGEAGRGEAWQAGQGGGQVDLLALPLHLVGAQNFLGSRGQQVLEEVHHVVEVGIGLVELNGGKLRVMLILVR